MAIIGDCGYWPYTLGRSVRLYTDECVVDGGTGLMGPCSIRGTPLAGLDGGGGEDIWGNPLARSGWGTPPPGLDGVPPHHGWMGYPPMTEWGPPHTSIGSTSYMLQVVCLLHSCRRTFLLNFIFINAKNNSGIENLCTLVK